jgi:Glycine cleavage T-protein C-terminal barrel domain
LLREIAKRGVTRKLVGVELGGARLGAYSDGSMPDFFPVTKDGALIGKVTSACFSPRLEKNIGYAGLAIGLPDSDLSASRRALARCEHHRRSECDGLRGRCCDRFDLDVGQPERPVGLALATPPLRVGPRSNDW